MLTSLHRVRQRTTHLLFMPRHPWRRLRGGLIIGLVVGSLLVLALRLDLLSGIRMQLTDYLYTEDSIPARCQAICLRTENSYVPDNPNPTEGITAIVAIDDRSLGAFGRTPVEWSRSVHTDLITFLTDAGARVIAFDVLFADPTEADAELADAMLTARNVIQPVAGGWWEGSKQTTPRGQFIQFDYYAYPAPALRDAAQVIGHVNVVPDEDGKVREVPLVVRDGDQLIPALALAAYLQYLRFPVELLEIEQHHVKFANRDLYTDDIGQMMISFFGEPTNVSQPGVGGSGELTGVRRQSTYPVYSYVDVLEGLVPPEAFEGKIVLVGVLDAQGNPDSYATPSTRTGKKMYGVEINASIIETIHQSLSTVPLIHDKKVLLADFGALGTLQLYRGTPSLPLQPQPDDERMVITFLLAMIGGLVLPFLRWYVALPLTILAYIAYYVWAWISFHFWGRVPEILFPALSLGLTFMGTLIVIYVFEERRRGQINDLFSRYVSAEIASKIVDSFDRGQLELGGEEREITVLFADVRGFTTLSEGLSPPEVVRILNVFLEQMTSTVMNYGGAVNKYIGDNMMAFWNAPYPQDDHAWLATHAALDMLEAIRKVNETGQFVYPVQFGIGINTGPVVVGNVGSERRLEYTPIGDTVNVASRLCGVAPGGTCYIGARTRELLGERVTPVAVHHLKLKGKTDAVEIHELHPPSSMASTLPSMRMEDIVQTG